MDDEWQLPVPREDPEIYKAGRARGDEGAVRLVPDRNIVEGETEEDGRTAPPSCPFS